MIAETLQTFWIPYEPPRATHQGSLRVLKNRDGHCFVGKPKRKYHGKLLPGQKTVEFYMKTLARHRPRIPHDPPLGLRIVWRWKYPKTRSKSITRAHDEWFCTEKPDNGNNLKIIEDCMESLGFFVDDCKISDHILMKREGIHPGIEVTLYRPEL